MAPRGARSAERGAEDVCVSVISMCVSVSRGAPGAVVRFVSCCQCVVCRVVVHRRCCTALSLVLLSRDGVWREQSEEQRKKRARAVQCHLESKRRGGGAHPGHGVGSRPGGGLHERQRAGLASSR